MVSSAALPTDTAVPVIDLSSFADDKGASPKEREAVAQQLHKACVEVGFVYIVGHGCPASVKDEAFAAVQALFASDEKRHLGATNSPLYRGYNSAETGSHSCTPRDRDNAPDLKESFTIGAEGHASPMHGPNQWPSQEALPQFEPAIRKYWDTMLNVVAQRLMKAMAQSLHVPQDFFLKNCNDPVAQMVMLKYPGTPEYHKRRGCGAHTDCGFLTLLAQDDVPGLQVQRSDGTWVEAPPIKDAFIVNLGDMMARWTNDLYRSTPHRVHSNAETRYSIPFFLNCNFDAAVECCFKDYCGKAKYPPTIAGKYMLQRLGLMHMMPADQQVDARVSSSASTVSADDDEEPAAQAPPCKKAKVAAEESLRDV